MNTSEKEKDERYLEEIIKDAGTAIPEDVAEEFKEPKAGRNELADKITAWYDEAKVNPTENEKFMRCVYVFAILCIKGYKMSNFLKSDSLEKLNPTLKETLKCFTGKYNVTVKKGSVRKEGELYIVEQAKDLVYSLGRYEGETPYLEVYKAVKPGNYASMKVTMTKKLTSGTKALNCVYHVIITKKKK